MKTKDFIKEDHNIAAAAEQMHRDHEVQMAREQCYNVAKNAIELHQLLKNISEEQGIDGWVASKITLAEDYIRTVREYLEYELMTTQRLGEDVSADVSSSSSIAAVATPLFKKKRVLKRKSS